MLIKEFKILIKQYMYKETKYVYIYTYIYIQRERQTKVQKICKARKIQDGQIGIPSVHFLPPREKNESKNK